MIDEIVLIKTQNNFLKYVNTLREHKKDFVLYQSSSKSTIIQGEFKAVYFPNNLKDKKGLYFIKKVKDYVKNNRIKCDFDLKINYIKLTKTLKENIWYSKDIYEIDLKAAFWNFFLKNGFCSRELYEEGLKVDKKVRLMSLGALAKTTTIFNYEDGKLKGSPIVDDSPETKGIFFKCAYDTDLIMCNLMKQLKKEDVYFYWVDAIFFKGKKNVDKIEEYLKSIGMEYKVVKIKKIRRVAECVEVIDESLKNRYFNFKKTVKQYV